MTKYHFGLFSKLIFANKNSIIGKLEKCPLLSVGAPHTFHHPEINTPKSLKKYPHIIRNSEFAPVSLVMLF